MKYYWIPGRINWKADNPIPSNGANNIKSNINALMFKQGYGAEYHTVHFNGGVYASDSIRY